VVRAPKTRVDAHDPPTDWVYRLRSHRLYRSAFGWVTQTAFPFVFGIGSLAAIALVAFGTANRGVFAAMSASGTVCVNQGQPHEVSETWEPVRLPSNALCLPTGLVLQQGQRYRVEVELPENAPVVQWRDASVRVDTPAGFSSGQGAVFMAFLPFRRVLTARWFVPVVRIGNQLAEYHPLNEIEEIPPDEAVAVQSALFDLTKCEPLAASGPQQRTRKVRGFAEFTPASTGQMFLFVNDAVAPWPWTTYFYDNNCGTATVRVRAVDSTAAAVAGR
jgi:hypothetical protein